MRSCIRMLANIVIALALVMVGAAADAAQAPGAVKDPAVGQGRSQIAAAVIRDLYARLAKYSSGTAGELRFKLDDFRTLSGERARQARLLDLFSPLEGRLVDVHIEHSAHGEDLRAAYRARWSSEEAPRLKDTAGYAYRNATLEDLIREASFESPELAEISAVTTYRVTVHLAGMSRTYRAAAFWIQLPDGLTGSQAAEARYVIQDHITVGLPEVAQETALALSDPPRQPVRAVPALGDLRKNTPVCAATSQSKALETVITASSQAYRPNFAGQINCTCDSACISGCLPVITQSSCGHASCRKTTTDLATKTAYAYAFGAAKGAECAAGWACVGIKCTKFLFWCFCGNISVKVNISTKIGPVTPSLEVGYTIAPSNAYSRKVDGVVVCPPCFAAGSPASGEPALYSGGGGDGGQDTVCGDSICDDELGESISNCWFDCGFCGDSLCGAGEDLSTCPGDCGGGGGMLETCGDGVCDAQLGECDSNCPQDCSGVFCQ